MTAAVRPRLNAAEGLWSRLDTRGRMAVLCVVAASVGVVGGQGATLARALVGAFGLTVFILIALSGRKTALSMVLVWLVLLGFVRRLLIPFAGWSPQDPLLLVSPAAAITLWFVSRGENNRPPRSVQAGLAGFLILWSLAQVINPNETDLVVGAQGVLFWVVPMLWFFTGRSLNRDMHLRIQDVVFWMGIPVVAHGLYQTFVDLLPFEYTWLEVSGQGPAILLPGFQIRPFSTLVSPQEYGQYLSFTLMMIWSRLLYPPAKSNLRPNRNRWLVVYLVFAATALFYQGGRTNFSFTILAFAITTIIRLRSLPALLLVVVLGATSVQFATNQSVTQVEATAEPESTDKAGTLARHQLSGITDPTGSTLPLHLELIERGIRDGISNPFGTGVSDTTIAGAKFDPEHDGSAENDAANVLAALGIPGGGAYIWFILAGFAAAARMQWREPSAYHLAALGILISAFTQWWSGALYATSTILFLTLGGLAREVGERLQPWSHRSQRAPAAEAV